MKFPQLSFWQWVGAVIIICIIGGIIVQIIAVSKTNLNQLAKDQLAANKADAAAQDASFYSTIQSTVNTLNSGK